MNRFKIGLFAFMVGAMSSLVAMEPGQLQNTLLYCGSLEGLINLSKCTIIRNTQDDNFDARFILPDVTTWLEVFSKIKFMMNSDGQVYTNVAPFYQFIENLTTIHQQKQPSANSSSQSKINHYPWYKKYAPHILGSAALLATGSLLTLAFQKWFGK